MSVHGKPFTVWAFYFWHFAIFVFLCLMMLLFTYGDTGQFALILERRGIGVLLGLGFWAFFFVVSLVSVVFTRITVNYDGEVRVRLPFSFGGGIFYSSDELRSVRWRMGGRAVNFSGTGDDYIPLNYFIVPLKYKELAEEISRRPRLGAAVPRVPKRLDYAILIVPILLLTLMGYAFRFYGFYLNPLIDGTLWGVVAFVSQSVFIYRSWNRYKYRNLGRVGSALAYGLMAAIPLFIFNVLFMFL